MISLFKREIQSKVRRGRFLFRGFFVALLLIGIGTLAAPALIPQAHAAVPWDFSQKILQCGIPNPLGGAKTGAAADCTLCDLFKTIKNVIEVMLSLTGAIALLTIIIAGTVYITGPSLTGDAKKSTKTARNMITYSIVGFVLIGLSWGIINTITYVTGLSRDWFTVDCAAFAKVGDEGEVTPVPVPAASYYCDDANGGRCVPAPATLPAGTTTYANSTCTNAEGKAVCAGIVEGECTDKSLAEKYHEPYPIAGNPGTEDVAAPELKQLIDCIKQNVPEAVISAVGDSSSPQCNYSRGHKECEADGQCGHSENSCHYGGRDDGTAASQSGSQAVDYAATGALGQKIVDAAINQCKNFVKNPVAYDPNADVCAEKPGARCENGQKLVACSDSAADHVHISSIGCHNFAYYDNNKCAAQKKDAQD